MKGKVKVLWVGDGGVATGFARVNHSIINNLPEDKYEIHHPEGVLNSDVLVFMPKDKHRKLHKH